jgi:hypothetical protein
VAAPQWPHAAVIDQSPPPGARIPASGQVELTIANWPFEAQVRQPDKPLSSLKLPPSAATSWNKFELCFVLNPMSYPNRAVAFANGSAISALISAAVLTALMAIFSATLARPLAAQDPQSKKPTDLNAGISVSEQATAKELGLPIYPGAKLHKDSSDDSAAANLGLWGGSFGFKLVALKLESGDSPEKIAAFYRKALGKYGPVLDCGNPVANKNQENDKSTKLTCGDDKPEAGVQLFKVGSKEKQHIVEIKPAASGSSFQLLYLEARGFDHESS